MKRIKVTVLAKDDIERPRWTGFVNDFGGEIESYEEKHIPKESDITNEYSFDYLVDGATEFANGIWLVAKGFWKMASWSIVIIWEGLRWLWKEGLGKKKDVKK